MIRVYKKATIVRSYSLKSFIILFYFYCGKTLPPNEPFVPLQNAFLFYSLFLPTYKVLN